MKTKVIITGATGFVGRKIAEALSKYENIELHLLVRDKKKIGEVSGLGRVCESDIRDAQSLKEPLAEKEVIIHCAALMSNFDSAPKKVFYETNVCGTENILRSCDTNTLKQFLHISTAGVYGDTGSAPAKENAPYGTRLSVYEWSKKEAETILMRYAERSGMPFTILRPSQMYGAGMYYGWLDTIKAIKEGRMAIPGRGDCMIHLLHIKDLVNAVKSVLLNKKSVNKIYNIAGPEAPSLKDIFYSIADILGVGRPGHVPYAAVYGASIALSFIPAGMKPGRLRLLTPHRVRFFATNHIYEISRARHELGYEPAVTLKDGLSEMIGWAVRKGLL